MTYVVRGSSSAQFLGVMPTTVCLQSVSTGSVHPQPRLKGSRCVPFFLTSQCTVWQNKICRYGHRLLAPISYHVSCAVVNSIFDEVFNRDTDDLATAVEIRRRQCGSLPAASIRASRLAPARHVSTSKTRLILGNQSIPTSLRPGHCRPSASTPQSEVNQTSSLLRVDMEDNKQ